MSFAIMEDILFLIIFIMTANEIIQLLGVLYLVMGFSFLFNQKYYRKLFKDITKSNIFMFLGWYIALVIGFTILLYFNELTLSKEWLVAVLWWIAFIKWILLLRFPNFITKISKIFFKKENFSLISFSIIIFWLILIYLGYFG